MPKNLPTPAQLWEGDVTFFSIDTDLIQGAGYDFESGALNQIPKQLPATMHLQLTEVVVNEIVRHLMEPVNESINALKSASAKLKRIAALDLKETDDAFGALNAAEAAEQRFRHGINEYAKRCRGGVLALKPGDLAHRMFAAYFSTSPPFGIRKDKKSEFPDAACLLSLEDFAREWPGKGILVSADRGWAAFAEESEYLYCVQTIDDLTQLFAATDEHGKAIQAQVTAAINDVDSPLHEEIKTAIAFHLDFADWVVGEIYTSSVARVEGEAHSVTLVGYELESASTKVWAVENEPASWVVEVSALVKSKVQITASFFVWDSIDREELELTSDEIVVEHDAEIPIYLTCHGVHSETNPSDWEIDVDIGSGKYEVDVGEVNPDFSDDWHG